MATNPAVRQQEGFLTFIFAVCTTAMVQNFAQTLQYDPCDSPAARELQSSSRTNEQHRDRFLILLVNVWIFKIYLFFY